MSKREVYAIDKITMEVVRKFGSVREAYIFHGCDKSAMYFILRNKTVSNGRFIFRYADEYDPNESFEGRNNRPIRVTDCETGEAYAFSCPSDAAKNLLMDSHSVTAAIRLGTRLCRQYKAEWLR